MGERNTVVSAYTMYRHLNSIALTNRYGYLCMRKGS